MTGDIKATMATMTDTPHVNHVPVMTGGVGREGVRHFYSNHLVGKFFPPDVELINVSRTLGEDQLVEEIVLKFTHTEPVDWMLPVHQPVQSVGLSASVMIRIKAQCEGNGSVLVKRCNTEAPEGLLWQQKQR